MRLAPVPPRSSVLPPGAGNEEAEKAVKTGKERAKKTEERYVVETGAVQRNLDTPTVARDRDGNVTGVPAIEQTQRGLHKHPTQPTRAVRAVYESMNDRATTRTAPFNDNILAGLRWGEPEAAGGRVGGFGAATGATPGHQETAGCPAVSSPWSDQGRPDYFQR
jgi:hypothetical protein